MDPRILDYYNRELQFMREMGAEFSKEFPKVAGRLGLDGFECQDPYVERLLEGFAFLAARVRLKVDAEFPMFTQHLLEMVYPNYTAPTPSMAIVQMQPDPTEGDLSSGFTVARGNILRANLAKGAKTRCEFRTAHDVTLWPIEISAAEYFPSRGSVATLNVPEVPGVKAGVRLRIRTVGEIKLADLPIDRLPVYLRGSENLPTQLFEQIVGNALGFVLRPAGTTVPWQEMRTSESIAHIGHDDSQALLPMDAREFHGYRLLHEYFAFPKRFLFVEFRDLASAIRRCAGDELEIIILFNRAEAKLNRVVSEENFALFCTPAANLFPRRADRMHISDKTTEYQVTPDRTRPMDYEVHSVLAATGYGKSGDKECDFRPFYSLRDRGYKRGDDAYFAIARSPRALSAKQKRLGTRSSYVGSEVFLSLVDASQAPFSSNLRQLALDTLCTNRDLAMHMPVGAGDTDFVIESGAPVKSVRCLDGPSSPRASHAIDSTAWRLISHLSLNFTSLLDGDTSERGAALRDILGLYADLSDPALRKQIEGVVACESRPVIRRLPVAGPVAFGRGLEVVVTLDESAFEGIGVFMLGTVLEQFFARYTSINSFTQTVVVASDRGEVMRWPARTGTKSVL